MEQLALTAEEKPHARAPGVLPTLRSPHHLPRLAALRQLPRLKVCDSSRQYVTFPRNSRKSQPSKLTERGREIASRGTYAVPAGEELRVRVQRDRPDFFPENAQRPSMNSLKQSPI